MLLLTVIVLLSLIAPIASACPTQKVKGELVYYEYRRQGDHLWIHEYYKLMRLDDGTPVLKYSHHGPIAKVIRVPEEAFPMVADMVRKYKLRRLKYDYTAPLEILAANTWNLWVMYDGGCISSGGFNGGRPPRRLDAGIEAVNAYLHSLTDNAADEDIIGYENLRERS